MARPGGSRPYPDGVELRGRATECAELDRVIDAIRTGQSRVVVVRGEPGVGKSALLNYAVDSAKDLRVLRAVGVESEMELAFAALHQLFAPLLDRLTNLPTPQAAALETVFGLAAGSPPDRFMVGLAVLSLLSDASGEQAVLVVVDDAQWLDRASAQVLGFVARRLLAESVGFLFGARMAGSDFIGLPELEVAGLSEVDSRVLLAPVFRHVLDEDIRARIVAEARGNPLALLELPLGLPSGELAGRTGQRSGYPLARSIEESFLVRVADLSDQARALLLLAAAEPVGDPALLRRAAQELGIDAGALADDGLRALLTVDDRVSFRHPLVRSAVYRAASTSEKRRAHLALSAVTDQQVDPDRRASHLASAAVGPDESVAEELERSASNAQDRGGFTAAAAFLQRSVALTERTPARTRRALAAAQVSLQAGEFDSARRMVTVVEADATEQAEQARALLLRGQIAFASGRWAEATPVLLSAANSWQVLDLMVARETYLDAWAAALFAGEPAADSLVAVSIAASSLPPLEHPRPSDLLLEGLATLMAAGRIAAAPVLRRAAAAFSAADAATDQSLRWGWLSIMAPSVLWDEQAFDLLNFRLLERARSAGALALLPVNLYGVASFAALEGDFAVAKSSLAEADSVVEATGIPFAPMAALLLAALQGRQPEATSLFSAAAEFAAASGQGVALQYARWAIAILYNGLGRYDLAFDAARQASAEAPQFHISSWALPELIEASTRTNNAETGARALVQLAAVAVAADTDWARGVEARSRALLSDGIAAETSYREAVDRLGRTRLRPELARAHLLYGGVASAAEPAR